MQANVAGLRRNIKNLAHNYSDAQIKVREATSNDPWGPSATVMAEVADLTYNIVAFSEIMQMIWKRLNDHGKNWRHVYKALILLEYLIKTGTEKVAQQCKENIYAIQTLKEFQYIEENKDQGVHVREKAKHLVALLRDEERLENERTKALKAKERFAQHASGFGSDGSIDGPSINRDLASSSGASGPPNWRSESSETPRSGSELEYVRPQTVGEEELQLQLAMAMSREEADQEEAKRRSDDVRLQLALSQSEQDFKLGDIEPIPKQQQQQQQQSHLMDLVDISLGNANISSPPPDPWGVAPKANTNKPIRDDPWSRTSSPPVDPWQPTIGATARSMGGATNVEGWLSRTQSPSVNSASSAEGWMHNNGTGASNGNVTSPVVDPWLSSIVGGGKPQISQSNSSPMHQDPWLNKSQPLGDAWQLNSNAIDASAPVLADPWAPAPPGSRPSPVGGINHELDEFDIITNRTRQQQSALNNNILNNNNYSMTSNNLHHNNNNNNNHNIINNNNINNNSSLLDEMDPLSMKKSSTKTPQSFLGENSALVNLDNLIKPAIPNTMGQPAPAYNPFGDMPPKTNLFQQQTQPVPSINQLKQSPFPVTLNQDPWAPINHNNNNNNMNQNNINNNWMKPPNQSSNPFLS